ncbi:MAG TPA: tripartite tricarboxylate transporter substrate binding protein [Burkholderiales bacterium]|nr:tripartite tricarboxylate transporter substrate binding protein [Burkholderiales bacterium]
MNRYLFLIPLAAATAAGAAEQGAFPSKPIRIVVPIAPGGSTDTIARLLATKLGERIPQPVVIDNRPGAGGNIGTDLVVKSPPDGYTVVAANVSSVAINQSLYKKMPYDPIKDLAPITLLAVFPNVIVVHPSFPAKNLKDLIALAKSKPGGLTFASAGNGSSTHLSPELLNTMAGIKMTHVPYKGGGPALVAVLSGEVSMYFSSVVAAAPQVKSGKLVPIAVTSSKRWPLLPDVPTVAESGLPKYEALNWIGLLAPARTPPAVLDWWNKHATTIFQEKESLAQLAGQGAQAEPMSRDQFAKYLKAEATKWAAVVKASGAVVD